MNRLLVVAILVVRTVPLYAQAQQPDMAKLKAGAQKVVSIISSDKAKTETFCELVNLGKAADEAIQEKDTDKLRGVRIKISKWLV